MSKKLVIIRVQPRDQSISRTAIPHTIPGIRHALLSKQVEHKTLLDVKGKPLIAVFDPRKQDDDSIPGWRMRGGKIIRGLSVLIGYEQRRGGAMNCPVDLEWAQSRIIWE